MAPAWMWFLSPFSPAKASDKESTAPQGIERRSMGTAQKEDMEDRSEKVIPGKKNEDPPVYDNLPATLLDPDLVFNAETFRPKPFSQNARDKAFAKAIVELIAWHMVNETNAYFEGNKGYCYGGKTTLPWDDNIGYPAVEAFKNDRISFILDQVRVDLGKRGFVVEKLDLVLDNLKVVEYKDVRDCHETAMDCNCWYHGIFAVWKFGIAE